MSGSQLRTQYDISDSCRDQYSTVYVRVSVTQSLNSCHSWDTNTCYRLLCTAMYYCVVYLNSTRRQSPAGKTEQARQNARERVRNIKYKYIQGKKKKNMCHLQQRRGGDCERFRIGCCTTSIRGSSPPPPSQVKSENCNGTGYSKQSTYCASPNKIGGATPLIFRLCVERGSTLQDCPPSASRNYSHSQSRPLRYVPNGRA